MALYELRCPSLNYVYRMTWAEFLIRLHAWRRTIKREDLAIREMAWITYIAPHQNPKKMKKNIKQFWPLPYDTTAPTDDLKERQRKAMREAMAKYKEELKRKKDG